MARIDSLQDYDSPMVESYTPAEPSVNPLVAAMRELQEEGVIESVNLNEGAGDEYHTGGAFGLPFPTTYEQENDMFKRKGPRRITAMTNEALDSSYPYEFKNNAYYFTTEAGNDYKVMFTGSKKVEVSFVTRDKTGQVKDNVTGSGDSRKVFGTVIEIVKDYVSQHNPEIIAFSSVSHEPSRVKLYSRLATQAGNALPNYTFAKTLKNAMLTTFYLTRDNIKVPKLDTVKNTTHKVLDKVFEETTTLNQLYKDGKPDHNETIWDYGTMIWDNPYEVELIGAHKLNMYLCDQYNVEFLEDLFDRMKPEQHEIVDKYINDPALSNSIIVLDNGYIVDGNHRAIAAALTKRPIKYIDIGEEEITEASSSRLKDLCAVKTNFPDADFWLQRNGSESTVGTPTKTFSPDNIGIKVTATDVLDPKYLYYTMMHIHNTGYWKARATGTLRLVHIKASDVANMPVGNNTV
jgi:hypothetical protein